MNLHEECLLKYLINPIALFESTENLKINNLLIQKTLQDLKELNGSYTRV